MNGDPAAAPPRDVFDEVFALLTPERLLHDPRATGEGVRVCVIDSGVERSVLEEKFASRVRRSTPSRGPSFTAGRPEPLPYDGHQSTPHGTTVADIILTLAPRVRLFSADVFGPQGSCEVEVVMQALRWAIDVWKCKVVNLSLGVPEHRLQQVQRRYQFLRAIEDGYYKDVLVVAAAHNEHPADAQLPGRVRPAADLGGQVHLRRPAPVRLSTAASRSSSRRTAAATWGRSPRSRPPAGPPRTWPASPRVCCRCGRS